MQIRNKPLISASVFINYRSADAKAATDIEAELTRRLGRGAVFRDAGMRAGTEFPRELMEKASECPVMISVIGEKWDSADSLRLLGDRADWVRREIVAALVHRVQIVPVLVGARSALAASDLPSDIRAIADLQAPHLRRNYDEQDVRRLVDELVRDLPALAKATPRGRWRPSWRWRRDMPCRDAVTTELATELRLTQ